jgi:glycosyltransferase involved in cell wall biosynthesis
LKVLHVVASYWPAVRYGGTIASVHGLCKALAVRGHDVHVFTTSVDGSADSDVPHGVPVDVDGVKVWYFRSPHLRRVYRSPALGTALNDHVREFDVVHTHAVFLWPMWAAARAATRAGVPYVLSPRGMLEKGLIARKSRLLKALWIALVEKRNLQRAAAIHVTSGREATELAAFGFDLPSVVEVPNGVDWEGEGGPVVPLSPAIREIVGGPPYVLFLGRVSWKKGLDRLIRAVPHMPAALRVVIAGNDEEGLQPGLERQAEELKVSGRFVFTGGVAGVDKQALLGHARVLVLPSYSENFGNVVVEAMAAGCPVIVTPEVGLASVVEAASVGWVVDGDDAQAFGARISELAGDEALRREMAGRGRLVAQRDYSWDQVAQRMESIYRTIAP